jgi:hypothetical protein
MADKTWVPHLSRLIKALSPKSELARFRNDYRDVVARLSAESSALLTDAREWVEQWATNPDVAVAKARCQWSELHARGRSLLPSDLLDAFLRKLPVVPTEPADWREFLIACTDVRLVETVVNMGHIGRRDVAVLVTSDPTGFYQSAAFDIAVDELPPGDLPVIWRECVRGGPRSSRVASANELLLRCYSRWPGYDADRALVRHLHRLGDEMVAVLSQVVKEPEIAARLVHVLVSRLTRSGKERQRAETIALSLVSTCQRQIVTGGTASPNVAASAILGLFRLELRLSCAGSNREMDQRVSAALQEAARNTAVAITQRIEENPVDPSNLCFVAIHGGELHQLVHSHLQMLASAVRTADSPAERGATYQTTIAKRDVLRQVMEVIDRYREDSALKEELEDLLFNNGVRTVGVLGETLPFDARLHESIGNAVLPGESVEVTRLGRKIGDESNVLVISKALVRRANE